MRTRIILKCLPIEKANLFSIPTPEEDSIASEHFKNISKDAVGKLSCLYNAICENGEKRQENTKTTGKSL